MDVQHKNATISNTADEFPGAFRVILSAPTKDRDGDTLMPEEWKQPLPEHITFDSDHGMSVATTVGSGRPYIDPDSGNLIVEGTYSSLPRAQEVRTLVNEGHIRTTSVAFMTEKAPQKDGTTATVRELLNGAFVAIPSNREALVLESKSAKVDAAKAGNRNNKADRETIQAIHDHAAKLGASCSGSDPDGDGDNDSDGHPEPEKAARDAATKTTDTTVSDAGTPAQAGTPAVEVTAPAVEAEAGATADGAAAGTALKGAAAAEDAEALAVLELQARAAADMAAAIEMEA